MWVVQYFQGWNICLQIQDGRHKTQYIIFCFRGDIPTCSNPSTPGWGTRCLLHLTVLPLVRLHTPGSGLFLASHGAINLFKKLSAPDIVSHVLQNIHMHTHRPSYYCPPMAVSWSQKGTAGVEDVVLYCLHCPLRARRQAGR